MGLFIFFWALKHETAFCRLLKELQKRKDKKCRQLHHLKTCPIQTTSKNIEKKKDSSAVGLYQTTFFYSYVFAKH